MASSWHAWTLVFGLLAVYSSSFSSCSLSQSWKSCRAWTVALKNQSNEHLRCPFFNSKVHLTYHYYEFFGFNSVQNTTPIHYDHLSLFCVWLISIWVQWVSKLPQILRCRGEVKWVILNPLYRELIWKVGTRCWDMNCLIVSSWKVTVKGVKK